MLFPTCVPSVSSIVANIRHRLSKYKEREESERRNKKENTEKKEERSRKRNASEDRRRFLGLGLGRKINGLVNAYYKV